MKTQVKILMDISTYNIKRALHIVRFGMKAPHQYKKFFINPSEVKFAISHPIEVGIYNPDEYSDAVNNYKKFYSKFWWYRAEDISELPLHSIDDLMKISACVAHWRDGLSWEETGIIEHNMHKISLTGAVISGCRTREDVISRYERLDKIFDKVARVGHLSIPSNGKLIPSSDGIQIHLWKGGELIFGDTGTHRLAMAKVLKLHKVPASLGFIHRDFLQNDIFCNDTSLIL